MVSNPPPGSNGPYTALPSSANGAGAAGIMPSAGHYADMQTLMQNLEALSGWLQQNREDSEWLTQNVRRVEHLPVSRLGHSTEAHPENSVESEDEGTLMQRDSITRGWLTDFWDSRTHNSVASNRTPTI